jgi:hypothetical protein
MEHGYIAKAITLIARDMTTTILRRRFNITRHLTTATTVKAKDEQVLPHTVAISRSDMLTLLCVCVPIPVQSPLVANYCNHVIVNKQISHCR